MKHNRVLFLFCFFQIAPVDGGITDYGFHFVCWRFVVFFFIDTLALN